MAKLEKEYHYQWSDQCAPIILETIRFLIQELLSFTLICVGVCSGFQTIECHPIAQQPTVCSILLVRLS